MSITFPHRDYEDALAPWTALLTSTVTHETTAPLLGTGSAKVITPGSAGFEGMTSGTGTADDMVVSVNASTEYTLSAYVRTEAAGGTLRPRVTERTAANVFIANIIFANVVPADTETARYSWTWTTGATAAFLRDFRMMTPTAQARTFYVDGWQLDVGPTALTYDGSDAPAAAGGANLIVGRGVGVSQPSVLGVRSVS